MLAVEKWAEGRPYLIALLAPQVASSAHDMNQAFAKIKSRCVMGYQFPLPQLPSWARLYRSHREPLSFFRLIFSRFSLFSPDSIQLFDSVSEEARVLRNNPEAYALEQVTEDEVLKAKEALDGALKESFLDIAADLITESACPSGKAEFSETLSGMPLESGFFYLVHVPCWLLYRESPTRLYRRARGGDVEALEKLLRLDALMIHDPYIGKQVQSFRFGRRPSSYRLLMEAPLKSPKAKITRQKMKYVMAGFISAFSAIIKQPLTEPEIRSLFDAVSQDAGRGDIDTDLPDSPESFYAAIRRDRDFWLASLDPYKKK